MTYITDRLDALREFRNSEPGTLLEILHDGRRGSISTTIAESTAKILIDQGIADESYRDEVAIILRRRGE